MLVEKIENRIYLIRGQKVMLDFHLAELYAAKTKALKQAVRRNIDRFPEDFMFQLNWEEVDSLRSQFVTLETKVEGKGKHLKYLPYAFTEQGVAMLSSVLKSKQAVQVNIAIMRAFVKLRQILATHKDIAYKLTELEKRVEKNEVETREVFDAIRQLMLPPEKPKRRIGFLVDRE
ncbi:DNA-binding protein [candidate division WOR-1 bacterium RIFOXYA12_FULL_43_27]|uniref:DNA-binding protein n=1 Tax=candidate division WOR-1 bacterium RIFOXYC2_FULL_46_14 TaxID=1802587 RepID=A0A1F4U5D1_UNCSA|nr:MAG: DNA-binding protein [candidate division WOR-1 bacterium RIFOXYA12_FULL_43_27]OGC20964.1 MAG: DNA-binding protein [candidate division WOR-1 bacterium RIFOXYB2_FULL_46_45]OGC32276.1 MAG: DNA-binding protein [candidate division WOR-1 bacterium RIFOXYA2_FULL_46_56]OGC40030.1 MAG: DNA-binding protein [candidate division WOR-1 bacterium RIFOXYC2_FULL_46_14]